MTNWIDAEIWFAADEHKPIHVATLQVEGEDNYGALEKVWEFTQSIEGPWIKAHQDKLMWLMDCKGLRSMSIGDYIRFEDGSIFQVVPIGFTQVDNMQPVPQRAGSTLIDRNAV